MKRQKEAVGILLLMAMLLSFCSCGSRNESREDGTIPSMNEAALETTEVISATSTWMDDPVIVAHQENNREVMAEKDLDRDAERFDLYVDNIKTMGGFISESSSEYQRSIQTAIDVAAVMFSDNLYGHAMVDSKEKTDASSSTLIWEESELDKNFTRKLRSQSFYNVKILPDYGTLDKLFTEEEPFKAESLSVIVTNFMGDYYDMGVIYNGIQRYFDRYPHSAALLMGYTSQYHGNLYLADKDNDDKHEFYITAFRGDIPFYMIVVGPEQAVKDYQQRMEKSLDDQDVKAAMSFYTNSVYECIEAKPLNFRVASDPGSVKEATGIAEQIWTFDSLDNCGAVGEWNPNRRWSSFNVGDITINDDGTVIVSRNRGVSTNMARKINRKTQDENRLVAGKYGRTDAARQLTLFSTDYNDRSIYSAEYQLYVFDKQSGEWVEASKGESSMVLFGFGKQEGPVSDYRDGASDRKSISVLPQDNTEYCLSTRLNYDPAADSVLNKSQIYRLEVRIRLNRANPRAESNATPEELFGFATTEEKFYSFKKMMGSLLNYTWQQELSEQTRETIRDCLNATPKLDFFLDSMSKLEKRYDVDVPIVEYVDIIFETGEEISRNSSK